MMETPASEVTTPSPQLSASSHSAMLDATSSSRKRASPDEEEMDETSPDMDAFLKRAHYGKLARELRARLSYATFKTSHNVSHLPLSTLEQKYGAKPRLSPSASVHNQQHQPNPSSSQALSPRNRATSSQLMPPPALAASPRNQSLYSALLGPAPMPPTKRARHAPPQASGPSSSQRLNPLSPQSMPPHSGRSIHNRHRSTGGIGDSDPEQITAAATLTSLLLKRPGSSVSEDKASSARSISRSSSAASMTVYTQSQPTQPSQTQAFAPGVTSSFVKQAGGSKRGDSSSLPMRPQTPQPDDAQAAELMLFLATSPSPRPSISGSVGHARTRSEGRPGQLLKARVLFGSSDYSAGIGILPSSRGSATPTGPTIGGSTTKLGEAFSGTTSALLPPAPSPASSPRHLGSQSSTKDVFDIGDFINTSPFPSQSSTYSRTSVRAEGRNLFGDDHHHVRGSGPSSSHTQSYMGSAGPSSVRKVPDAGMLGPPLGPAMGANV